jgi:hypothetical protein
MKTPRIPLFIVLAAITGTASAQTPPPPAPLLAVLDGNRDGGLSPLEIKRSPINLAKLDKNGDGRLTPKELLPPPPPVGTPPPPLPDKPSPLMVALDLNKDGILSAAEIEDAPLSLKILDKNKDGRISPKELAPPTPPIAPTT